MAGDEIVMSPVAMLMIHNPATAIFGEASDFQSGIEMLSEVKESIINAYQQKTGLGRNKISKMMDAETWFNAKKAVELGFADRILYEEGTDDVPSNTGFLFDKITVTNALLSKLPHKEQKQIEDGTPHEQLLKRLNFLKY
jgi:ATP-dependent Clp protease protease subunit